MIDATRLRRAHAVDQVSPPRLFAVLGWGCNGSRWLTHVFNGVPHVFALHEARYVWELWTGAPRTRGDDYMQMVSTLSSGNVAAGDIGSILPDEVGLLKRTFGEAAFNVVGVTRHPLTRAASALALLLTYFPDKSEDELLDGVAQMLSSILDERAVAPVFRMEDITIKFDALSMLVKTCTGTGLPLKTILPTRANGRAKTALTPIQSERVWSSMDLEARKTYERLGYAYEKLAVV